MTLDSWGSVNDAYDLKARGFISEAVSIVVMRSVWSFFYEKPSFRAERKYLFELIGLNQALAISHADSLFDQAMRLIDFPGELDHTEDALISSNINTTLCFYVALSFSPNAEIKEQFNYIRIKAKETPKRYLNFSPCGAKKLRSSNLLEYLNRVLCV